MLTVYSTYGSPGASTTAACLAAHWASTGRQVLLIETDAAVGSLSQKLGIQFTPGTASFVAAGKPVTASNLIDHAQDVLFSDFHVMPTPSSPSGAAAVAAKFARLGEELRDIADGEMAVVVDGGRLSADARTSELTTSAAAVLVVTRDSTQLSSLEHVSGVLVDDVTQPGPLGLVATVGPSPLGAAEWFSEHGLTMVGSIDLGTERGIDLTMFMPRAKRKSRKLRGSLEKLADVLYEFACPAGAAAPRARLPSLRPPEQAPPAPAADTPAAGPADPLGVASAAAAVAAPLPAAAYPQQSAAPPLEQPALQHDLHSEPVHYAPAHSQPLYPHHPDPGGGPPQPDLGHASYVQQQPYPEQQPYLGQPSPAEHQPPADVAAEAPVVPTGSFRSWAAQLFGETAGGDPSDRWPPPGTGATA